jgi:acyl-CoA synthetase (NDP forming)
MVALGDTWKLGADVDEAVNESPAIYSRSSDRMLRAIAHYIRYGRLLARTRVTATAAAVTGLPKLECGAQPEWLGKKVLAAAGIRLPDGALARTPDEAVAIAKRVGYPVALKAQAAALSRKTEAGGVALNLSGEAAVRDAWDAMMRSVKRAAPGLALDGALVEKMSPRGVELMVGAKRDQSWGTVLLLGLGGIWVEALGDVQALPASADEARTREALGKLRSATLLAGVRGAPPADLDAVVHAVLALGRLMQSLPEVTEVDVNPLMIHAEGQGATALDALIVTA